MFSRQYDRPVRMPLADSEERWQYFELKADLTPGSSADAYFLRDDGAGGLERIDSDPPNETWREAEVKDLLGITRGKGADDDASPDPLDGTKLLARPVGDEWHIVAAQPWPLRIRGQLTAALATTDSTFTIDNVQVMSPIGAIDVGHILDASDEVTVSNTHTWEGDDNGVVRAEWNENTQLWEAYQVDCPA